MNKGILDFIQQNKTKEAIFALKEIGLSAELQKALAMVESEFNGLSQDILKGTISFDEKQIRRNRINDKLLSILQSASNPEKLKIKKKKKYFLYLVPVLLITIVFVMWNFRSLTEETNCPAFKPDSLNKILLIPFENVGNEKANPEILIRDRISQLTANNNLSTTIKLGKQAKNLSIEEAPELAKLCHANVIIWGKYSNKADSISLILQYHFLDRPDWSNMGELVVLKDVTAIRHGTMFKNIEDSIMSLCSVIAVRQGREEITKKWLSKIDNPEDIDDFMSKWSSKK